MKKAYSLVLVLSVIVFGSFTGNKPAGDELKWEHWNTGYPRGIKEKKIILIDAYTDWCGWCKKMDRDTYDNKDIIKKINQHFVPIKFNPELKETYYIDNNAYSGQEIHNMLSQGNRTGYPTTYFLITTTNKLFINPGYEGAKKFGETLDKMIKEAGL